MFDLPLVDRLALPHSKYLPLASVLPLIPYLCLRRRNLSFSSLVWLTTGDDLEDDVDDSACCRLVIASDNCLLSRPKVRERLLLPEADYDIIYEGKSKQKSENNEP